MSSTTANQFLFIDSRVTNIETLLATLDPSIEVVLLDATQDGVVQIANALAGRSGVDAVHIISHGSAGSLFLGASTLTESTLGSYALQFETIRAALTASADLLLYGCNVAEGETGTRFIDALADATGADVAASVDLSGSALFGGNWALEAATGTIETTSLGMDGYDGVLAPSNAGFESDFTGWVGSDAVIGTGAVYQAGSNAWTVNPYGSKMAVVQPAGPSGELGGVYSTLQVGSAAQTYLNSRFSNPTNFGYVYTDVTLAAGETFDMAWNYVATDYSPYNDASWISVVNSSNTADTSMQIRPGAGSAFVGGQVSILGATVTGTGNYVTGNYGSTGWQTVSIIAGQAGTYRIGFAVFNLGDTVLSPYLFVDQAAGTTLKNGTPYGPVPAPAVLPPPPVAPNAAPVFSATTYTSGSNTFTDTAGDDVFSTTVGKVNATDANGDAMTFAVTGGSSSTTKATTYGTFTITNTSTGAFTYAPNNAAIQALKSSVTDNFTVTVSDGKGGTATTTVSFSLQGSNDTTVFGGTTSGAVAEDGNSVASGTVTAADRDTGDAAILPSAMASVYGVFVVNASGQWTYTLSQSATAVQSLNAGVLVHDNFTITTAGGATQNVSIAITGTNDLPTLSSPATMLTLAEDANPATGPSIANLFGGRFVDVDSGSSFGGILISANAATAAQGAWFYKAAGDAGWTAIPTSGLSTTSALALAKTTLIKFVPAADYNGTPGALTVYATDDQYAGGFTPSGGPAITSATAVGGVSLAGTTLSITISPVNDAPVFTTGNIAQTLAETPIADSLANLSGNLAGSATDVENDVLTFSIQGGATVSGSSVLQGTYGKLTLAPGGAWVYTPNRNVAIDALDAGQTGVDTFTLKVSDPSGASATKTLTVSITGANDLPVLHASLADHSFAAPGSWIYQIPVDTVTDAEGTGLTYSVQLVNALGALVDLDGPGGNAAGTLPSWLNFDAATRTFTGNPPKSLEGTTLHLKVTIADNHGAAVTSTFAVNLGTNLNDAPTGKVTITNQTSGQTTGTIAAQQGDVLVASDTLADGDGIGTITYTWYANGVAVGTGSTYTLDQANVGKAITVVASYTDDGGVSESVGSSPTAAVSNVNDAPTGAATATLPAATEDNTYYVKQSDLLAGFTDPDGDVLSVTGLVIDSPPGGTISALNPDGTFAIQLPANYDGAVVLKYNVQDLSGSSVPATQSFTVKGVNDGPTGTASALLADGTEDTPYIVQASDLLQGFTDAEGDSLQVINLQANHGTVTDNGDGTFTIVPTPNYSGLVTLSYQVIDGNGGKLANGATQSFSLSAVDDAPVLTAPLENQSAQLSDSFSYTVAGNFSEVDGGPLNFKATLANGDPLPSWLVFDENTGTFSVSAGTGEAGAIGVKVTAYDGAPGLSNATTTSFVLSMDAAPPAGPYTGALADGVEDTAYTVSANVLLSVFAGDIDPLTASVLNLSADHGTVIDNGDGTFTIKPDANYAGPITLSYGAIDGAGIYAAASLNFVLASVPDAPQLSTPLINPLALQGKAITPFSIASNFSDAEGATLNFKATLTDGSPLPTWLHFDEATGEFSGTPDKDAIGAIGIKVVAYDGADGTGMSTQATFVFNVTSTPIASDDSTSTVKNTALVLSIADFGDYFDPQGGAEAYVIITRLPTFGTLKFDGADITPADLQNNSGLPGTSPLPSGETGYWVSVSNILLGKLSFIPNDGYAGTTDLGFKVEKNPISFDEYTLAIDVADTDDAPVLQGAPAVLAPSNEDTVRTVLKSELLQGYVDPEGGTLDVVGLTADHGTVTDNGDGTYTITPALNFYGLITLSYGVSDGVNILATDLSYNVLPVNDAPVLLNPVGDKTLADVQTGIALPTDIFSDIDGDTLTVTPTLADGGALPGWLNWDGATLKLSGTPPGGTPYVDILLTAADGNGGSALSTFRLSLTSGASGTGIETANHAGEVTVSASAGPVGGVYVAGTVLTANVSDTDGFNAGNVAYQWQISANGVDGWTAIPGASASTLTLGLGQSNQYVRVSTYYTDNGNILETPVSSPAIHVQKQDHAGSVNISGTPAAGYTLAATLTDTDGLTGAAPTYTWKADGVTVQSGTSNAYTLTNNEGGKTMSVSVSYTDDEGFTATLNATDPTPIQIGIVPPVPAAKTGSATEKSGIANATAGSTASGDLLAGATDANAGDVIVFDSVRTGSVAGLGSPAALDPIDPAYVLLNGTYGQLRVKLADGTYTYTLSDNASNVQQLRAGATATESFNYSLRDQTGLVGTTTLTITVNGADDAPTGSGVPATANVTEDVAAAVSFSTLVLSDIDGLGSDTYKLTVAAGTAGATLTSLSGGGVTVAGSGTGTLTLTGSLANLNAFIANAGAVNYTSKPNDDTDDTLTLTLQDVTTVGKPVVSLGTVAVAIAPVNDAPTLDLDADNSSGATGSNYVTDYTARSEGKVRVVDTDILIHDNDSIAGAPAKPDSITLATVAISGGALDNLFGSYEKLQALGASIVVQDGETRFKFANYDASDSSTYLVVAGNGSAKVSFIGTGTWAQYQEALKSIYYENTNPNATAGARTITVTVKDGSVTTSGDGSTDDANVLSATATTTLTVLWAPVVDLDGEATPNVDARNYAVNFTENGAPVAIAAPDASITDLDGNIKEVKVTLRTGDLTAPVGAEDVLTIGNSIVTLLASKGVTTVISPDGHTITFTGNVDSSPFQLGVRAVRYQNTSESPTKALVRYVDVTATDMQNHVGVGATTTITVKAQNDAPTAVADVVTVGEAGGVLNGTAGVNPLGNNVLANDTDLDAYNSSTPALPETKTVSAVAFGGTPGVVGQPLDGLYGSLTLNPNGTYAYSVNNGNPAVEALRSATDTLTEVFTYTMVDSGGLASTSTLTVTITGANDAPVITVGAGNSAAKGLDETDSTVSTSGTLSVQDVDLLDNVTASVVSVVASGATSGLNASNATLRSMLHVDAGAIIDATHTTGTLHWNFDSATTQSVPDVLAYSAAFAAWTVGGNIGPAPNPATYVTTQPYNENFNYLAAGEQLTLTYSVRASDGSANTDRDVVITITGTNDAPVVASIVQSDLTEQGNTAPLTSSITVNFTDVDLADVGHTVTVSAVVASGDTDGLALDDAALIALLTPGAVTKNAGSSSGTVALGFSAASTAFDYLAAGQTLTLTYTATVDDGDGGTVTKDFVVTIAGTTDAPVLSVVDVAGSITEGSVLSDSGAITFTDVDLTDLPTATSALKSLDALKSDGLTTLALSGAQETALTNAFSLSADAGNTHDGTINWSYTIAETALDFLAKDETVTAVFTITVDDGHGGTATQDVTVTLTGSNDKPSISVVDVAGAITEAGGNGTLSDSGSITFADLDLTDLPTASTAVSTIVALKNDGTTALNLSSDQLTALTDAFSLAAAGGNTHNGTINWTYAIAESDLDFLGQGDTITAVFTITVDDHHGGTATQDVTITLTGTNDAPILDLNGADYVGTGVDVLFNARGDAVPLFDQDANGQLTLLELADKDDGEMLQQIVLTLDPDTAVDNLGTTFETLFSTEGTGSFTFDGHTLNISGNGTTDSPLMISGVGSLAAYKAALATLRYIDTNQNAFAGVREVNVTVTDVGATFPTTPANPLSTSATLTISVNWNPVVDLNGPGSLLGLPADANAQRDYVITYTEKQPTVAYVASSTATLFDQNGLIGKVVVKLNNPQDGAAELLSIDAGVVATLTGFGISTTVSGDSHTITFESINPAGCDVSQFQLGVRGVQYKDTSSAPNESVVRQISVLAYDTDGSAGVGAMSYVNVVGVNVPPTLQAVSAGSVTEDALASTWTDAGLSGTLVGADEDLQVLTYGITDGTTGGTYQNGGVTYDVSKVGTRGTLYVESSSGKYLFVPDSTKVNALAATETDSESFSVFVWDKVAAKVTQTYAVTLTGTNDAPTVAAALTANAAEGSAAFTRNLLQGAADVDAGETATLTISSVTYAVDGGVPSSTAPDGVSLVGSTLSVNPAHAAFEHLAKDVTTQIVVSYLVTDAQGATVPQTETITITGTNDTPTIVAADTDAVGGVTEDGVPDTLSATGTLAFDDVDLIDAHTANVVADVANTLGGSLTLGTVAEDGSTAAGSFGWTYEVANSATQYLAEGETATESFTVTVSDGHGGSVEQVITITVTGTNDAPTIVAADTGAAGGVTESADNAPNENTGTLSDSGVIAFADIDLIDTHTASVAAAVTDGAGNTVASPLGSLTLDPIDADTKTVGWTFSVDAGLLDSLAAGQTLTQVYTVTIDDSKTGGKVTQDITVTITGTNDAPTIVVVSTNASGDVSEDDAPDTLTATGTLAFDDVDLIDTHTGNVVADIDNTLGGTLTLGSVSEDGTSSAGTFGWTYEVANGATQYLAEGETVTESFTVTVSDGHGGSAEQVITITVTGTNDQPTIVAADTNASGDVSEDDDAVTLSATGTLAFDDIDLIDAHSGNVVADLGNTLGGTLTLGTVAEDGTTTAGTFSWTYEVANSAAQYLAEGETVTESFTVTVSDGQGGSVDQIITVTVTGTNDAPTIVAADTNAVGGVTERADKALNENTGTLSDSGVIAFADVDLIDTHIVSVAAAVKDADGNPVQHPLGGLTLGAIDADTKTVGWTFSVGAGLLDSLTAGETLTQVYTVTIDDSKTGGKVTQDITVTLTGTNDAPTVAAALTANAAEGSAAFTRNLLQGAADVDAGETATLTISSVTYAVDGGAPSSTAPDGVSLVGSTLSVNPAHAAFDHLAKDVTTQIVVSYLVTDAQGATVPQTETITITGTNDTPTAIGVSNTTVAENTSTTGGLLVATLTTTDVDDGDTFTYSILNGTDSFYFEIVGNELRFRNGVDLNAETKSVYAVTLRSTDANGAFVDSPIHVNVSDVNEFTVSTPTFNVQAMAGQVAPNTVAENTTAGTFTGITAVAYDADLTNNVVSYALVGDMAGAAYTAGEFAVNSLTGEIAVAGTIDREVGATRTLFVKATSQDGSSKIGSLTLNITDVNEFAVGNAVDINPAANTVVENAALNTRVGITARAVDGDATTNTVTYALVDADGGAYSGTEFEIDAVTGVVSVAGSIDRELGATRTIHVQATSTDGSTSNQAFTINVTDLDDNAPVFTSGAAGSVAENAATSTVIYTAAATDADATAAYNTVSYALKDGGDKALLNINAVTGAVTLKASANFEAKAAYSFTVQASDGNHVTEKAVTVSVINVDEAATGTLSVTGLAQQGGAVTAQLTATDVDSAIVNTAYLWQVQVDGNWEDIQVTSATLDIPDVQQVVGLNVRVVVTTTDALGGTTAFYSDAINIANVNDDPTGTLTINGSAAQGQTLSVSSTVNDLDGMGTISYQWLANGVAIDGATGATLALGQSLVDKAISVTGSYTDGFGKRENITSAPTASVANVNDAPTGAVTITSSTGSIAQNAVLSVANTLADADGLGLVTYTWLRGSTTVGTGNTYTLTEADVGLAIHAMASYTDGYGAHETASSAVAGPVLNVNDAPTGGVTISGSAKQGQTLSAANTLGDIDGLGTIQYQWLADGVAINGATGSTLTLGAGVVGKAVSVQASYIDGHGTSEAVTSAATVKVAVTGNQETSVPGGTAGDGNGDGIPDAIQSSVVSSALTTTTGGSSFVTLAATSSGSTAANPAATVTSFTQNTQLPADLPVSGKAPLGSISFTSATDTISGIETFSFYVDASLGVNGYWVTKPDGTLTNLASEANGGRMVLEGDKLRIDFQVADGSTFDHDGTAGNNSVQVEGALAYVPMTLISFTPDAPEHNTVAAPIWD